MTATTIKLRPDKPRPRNIYTSLICLPTCQLRWWFHFTIVFYSRRAAAIPDEIGVWFGKHEGSRQASVINVWSVIFGLGCSVWFAIINFSESRLYHVHPINTRTKDTAFSWGGSPYISLVSTSYTMSIAYSTMHMEKNKTIVWVTKAVCLLFHEHSRISNTHCVGCRHQWYIRRTFCATIVQGTMYGKRKKKQTYHPNY